MALANMPAYMVGRSVSNCRVTPLTVTITPGTSALTFSRGGTTQDIASAAYYTFDSFMLNSHVDSEEISAANALMRNYVLTKDDFELTLKELRLTNPSNNAVLFSGWIGFDYFLAEVMVQPYGAGYPSPFMVQAICVRSSLDDEYAEGKGEIELHGKACGFPVAYIPYGNPPIYSVP